MSDFLFIYIDENTKLDRLKTIRTIFSMDKVYGVSVMEERSSAEDTFNCVLSCYYKFDDNDVPVRLGKDLTYVSLKNTGKAALNFALELQQLLDVNLTVTNTDYTFLCKLNEISSLEELENAVENGIYMDEQ